VPAFNRRDDFAEAGGYTRNIEDVAGAAGKMPLRHIPGNPIVYRVECADSNKSRRHDTLLYGDDPWTFSLTNGPQSSHLSGNEPIYQLQNYVRRFEQPSFVIFKTRQCTSQTGMPASNTKDDETMLILDNDLRQAIQKTTSCPLASFLRNGALEFPAPYQLLYYLREDLNSFSKSVDGTLREQIQAVIQYVVNNFGHEYDEAERLISHQMITLRHLNKIFRPNHMVVRWFVSGDGHKGVQRVHVVRDWPRVTGAELFVPLWTWEFDEWECCRYNMEYSFPAPVEDETEPFPVEALGIHPISILSPESIESLQSSGKKSWDLRQAQFVHCTGGHLIKSGRYMIDHKIYKRLHQSKLVTADSTRAETRNKQTDPWRLSLGFHDEPTDNEFLIMPTELPGYDLQEKEWVNLPVSTLTSIRWNKQPFEDLVLNEEMKRLVRAVVTVRASSIRTRRQQGPRVDYDMIAGKGNGLIMLFHGSPGTGKTLTAESVAEIAQMPLFPITCGDMGTEPDKVEAYLQLVFELGQSWNCVLLLDEADVFLEERTLTDLQRNSLVSVFLRMLEYYEGILILTSNRVGTFDEAFRSRIHIALHYEDLKPRARKTIWSNFLSRLEGTEEGENITEIEQRLDELANHKLNGREIRNALATARQLAYYEGEKMGWEHLELAIKTANKFGKYLTDVHGHSASSWAKEKRERL
jgi:hypothetical protein